MTDAALVLKDSPVTDKIGPCEKCHYEEEDDSFAYARAIDLRFWVHAGCINCANTFMVSSAQLDDDALELLPISSTDEFEKAVRAITSLRRWIRAGSVAELNQIHLDKQSCAFCIHRPDEDPDGCWCPLCLETEDASDSPFVDKADYDDYARDCVSHRMAPPHFNGQKTETCKICQNKPGPVREE